MACEQAVFVMAERSSHRFDSKSASALLRVKLATYEIPTALLRLHFAKRRVSHFAQSASD